MSDEHDPESTGTSIFELFGDPPPVPEDDLTAPPADGPTVDAVFGNDLDAVPSGPETSLPHWTEPPTGQLPKVLADAREGDDPWSELQGPRWHGDDPAWADDDLAEVFGDEPALAAVPAVEIPEVDEPALPTVTIGDIDDADLPSAAGAPQRDDRIAVPTRPRPTLAAEGDLEADSGGRNMGQAVGVGLAFAVVAGLAFVLGPFATLCLVLVIVVLAAAELFAAMRRSGLHPATLFGIVGAAAMPAAVYARDERMVPLIVGLLVVFGALWWIVGADTDRPALNLGLTHLGVLWIGGLATFAALLLKFDSGIRLLLIGVVITVATDTGAFALGRSLGRTPFHPASPNKTVEGTLGGICVGVVAAVIMWVVDVFPIEAEVAWSSAVLVGIVCSMLAVLGDLTESMIKRDLGVKDMGTILPGHGGILDRMDGLLFVLPGIYYLTLVLELV